MAVTPFHAVARASRGRRRRTRERVRGMSESPMGDDANRLGRGWLKEVPGCRAVMFVTEPPYTYSIGWGGGGGNWCPTVAKYC
jgi:hypothetical protein